MITEKEIQKLLDNLRLGKYDSPEYEIKCMCLHDQYGSINIHNKDTDVSIHLHVDKIISYTCTFNSFLGIKFNKKIQNTEQCIVEYNHGSLIDTIKVNKDLYDSLIAYIREQVEKDRLIDELNFKAELNR